MSLPDFWDGERRGPEEHAHRVFRWVLQAQMPRFLQQALTELPQHPRHGGELEL